jgi:ectoine hydroxylase-related dioxygenase (phytanoyl-CoA dioxygenase family)
VYYLDLPKDTPRTQWINPTNLSEETFDVAEGDIIIFPSWLIHRAPQNKSKEMKTIISWNIEVGISDFYGEDQ